MRPTAPKHVPIDKVTRYPGNARTHNLELIQDSLTATGQYKPLLVQTSTGHILAGNGTHEAALRLEWAKVWVSYLDVDDETARRIVLVDNRASDQAGYDDEALTRLLRDMDDLEGTGFDTDDLDSLLAKLEPDPDDGPPEDEVLVIKFSVGSVKAPATQEEYDWVKAAYSSYVEAGGTDYGFVTWMLNGDARGFRP